MNTLIPVGIDLFAIVDDDLAGGLAKFHWRPRQYRRCIYAVTKVGKVPNRITFNMHRLIAKTPFGMVCHHINGNPMDNRRENLVNMSKKAHTLLHANNKICIKFEKTNTEKKSGPVL